jgi:hypothetical protein
MTCCRHYEAFQHVPSADDIVHASRVSVYGCWLFEMLKCKSIA